MEKGIKETKGRKLQEETQMIQLTKHYDKGKLVNVTITTIEKSPKEINDWYDFEEMRLQHEEEIQDRLEKND